MQTGTPEILYEDNHLIFVYKPHGWLVHGDHTKDASLGDWLKKYIKDKYKKPGDVFLGTIHRLDRPVAGVMVFARTSKSLERMNKLFAEKKVKKIYQALIQKKPAPEKGILLNWLWKNSEKNRVELSATQINPDWKQAETHYHYIKAYTKFQLIELIPVTGRS
ncbi:MAG TPA: RNA pseudouridine synthase, partial [Saprospiraceae bacterium]|nr:RNA pseudouridine synthase [Saprospiraceae bacterium]